MQRVFPNSILAAIGLLLALVNGAAIYFHLFYSIWWLDIPMHVVGGLWVALIALAFYFSPRMREPKRRTDPAVLAIGVLSAFAVGLLWEVFEFSLDTYVTLSVHDMSDTLNDLLNDLIGATIAADIFVTEKFNRICHDK